MISVDRSRPEIQRRISTHLGGLVFRCGKEVGTVGGELDVVDLVVELVGLDVLNLITGLLQPY